MIAALLSTWRLVDKLASVAMRGIRALEEILTLQPAAPNGVERHQNVPLEMWRQVATQVQRLQPDLGAYYLGREFLHEIWIHATIGNSTSPIAENSTLFML